ncbi:hypothetical protein CRG98_001355 [Punica granatum]|uniref:glucan endo-1,3-beta-D-glucosidase n=1 Tax=Punica granatum TaxID=22663 RepID=A0A2I0LC93_PUNGR|nr:hypothetical protein CRG98_001355 [Punica granatum]
MASAVLLLLGLLMASLGIKGVQSIGVCYGMLGNNLPPAKEVVALYKSRKINRMRIYDPNQATLQALRGSNIELMLGVPNSDLQALANNPSNAKSWVQRNVKNYSPGVRFRYIAVGNEVGATSQLAKFVLPAMRNVQNAVNSFGLQNQVKVSTAIDMIVMGNSYPPSQGAFRADARGHLDPIIRFLVNNKSPLLANIYTYFSYAGNPKDISLPYALFTSPGVVVRDGARSYQNLFDAMLDALYSALERAGGGALNVVVSESGWPSAGAVGATVGNAGTYYKNFIKHVPGGTPKRPKKAIESYLFAMFDENQKQPELEKHFGLFSPNKQPKYPLSFGESREGIWDVSSSNYSHGVAGSLRSDI